MLLGGRHLLPVFTLAALLLSCPNGHAQQGGPAANGTGAAHVLPSFSLGYVGGMGFSGGFGANGGGFGFNNGGGGFNGGFGVNGGGFGVNGGGFGFNGGGFGQLGGGF